MQQSQIDYILSKMLESHSNVSDLNITAGKKFQVESSGQLIELNIKPEVNSLTPFQTEIFALNLIDNDRRLIEDLIKRGSCDFSYQLAGKARFRGNIFSQRNCYSTVLRKLETTIPTIDQIKLPQAFQQMALEKNGIILVTGATGSGKSTSLAALLNDINEREAVHVITLEDPVEFVHPHKKATFNQRELGQDFDTFANGLRAALRQAPKVILVGEMRDRETVEIGMSAAETGHLVLSTLHTVDAGQTINRILGMFEQEEEHQIRIRLADTMRWIASQRLLPKEGGGRVAVFEIMGSNLQIKDMILNGETEEKTFYNTIANLNPFGMQTFDQSILALYGQGLISEETAMAYASKKAIVGRGIDTQKAERGEKTTDIEGLTIDSAYGKTEEQITRERTMSRRRRK
ncbi:MAG: PilT/PilU family type 4a pilus ATPase [Deltaproteobacteria bacterium]|nr:PilT/PilU family type 4a pilus ATPase [Deltaproteobacteria bacterium]MBW2323813.1 PilT/PilU family type 4a pilus ATPase [Deltaproteobacteria bacterium]